MNTFPSCVDAHSDDISIVGTSVLTGWSSLWRSALLKLLSDTHSENTALQATSTRYILIIHNGRNFHVCACMHACVHVYVCVCVCVCVRMLACVST